MYVYAPSPGFKPSYLNVSTLVKTGKLSTTMAQKLKIKIKTRQTPRLDPELNMRRVNPKKRPLPINQNKNKNPRKKAKHNNNNKNNNKTVNEINGGSADSKETLHSVQRIFEEYDALKCENAELEAKYETIDNALAAYKHWNTELKQKNKVNKKEYKDLLQKFNTAQKLKEKIEDEHAELKASFNELKYRQDEVDRIHKADISKLKQKYEKKKSEFAEEIATWEEHYYSLEAQWDELKEKINFYEGKSEKFNTMSIAQLNALKRTLQNTINEIEIAKEKKDECVICMGNQCNIAFIGCGHCVLCDACEKGLVAKVCPQCQLPYSNILQIVK